MRVRSVRAYRLSAHVERELAAAALAERQSPE
jgi:hypothetical protein